MSKYLKLLAVVEEDYKMISGNLDPDWQCDNVLSIKLNDDFSLPDEKEDEEFSVEEGLNVFIYHVLEAVKTKSKERSDE